MNTTENQTEAQECLSCGVQLLPDGTVDALGEEDGDDQHYAGCTAPTFDEIEVGQRWYVASRDMDAIVDGKFRCVSAGPNDPPAGTPYIRLHRVGHTRQSGLNYPWQLVPARCIGRRRDGAGPTVPCGNAAQRGTEYCEVCAR